MSSNFLSKPILSADFLERILRQISEVPTTEPIPTPAVPAVPTLPTKSQKRCPTCRHKLQLADMACRCGLRHCSAHRLPETHGCTFDHKVHDRKLLESQVIRCIADKMKEERI
jgi:hypothetical protein